MTRTATTRRIAAALGAVAAVALLATPLAPASSASAGTDSSAYAMSAKARSSESKAAAARAKAAEAKAAIAKARAKAAADQAAQVAAVQAAQVAAASTDFSSIFADQMPAFDNSGWATCAAPIPWSVDVSNLDPAHAETQVANLQWALDQWAQTTGLAFQYAGPAEFIYDDATFTLTREDGTPAPERHIYLSFVNDEESARLGGGTVGLGGPSQVWQNTHEITAGFAIFRTDHVERASQVEDRSLFLHELGHVMGLAHAQETLNIMYPVVSDHTEVGPGDAAGVRSMLKPCAEAAEPQTF
jgi:hypothetical protein